MIYLRRDRLLLAAFFLGAWNEKITNAFLVPTKLKNNYKSSSSPTPTTGSSPSSLDATYDPYGHSSSSNGDCSNNQHARTDLRNFLTQRSIQSFVFVLNQCKEGHTVRWLENKLDFTKIDSYHGTGAFNLTTFPEWDSLFLDLATQDAEKVIIEVVQKKTRRGWGHQANYVDSINNNNNGASASSSSATANNQPTVKPRSITPWSPRSSSSSINNNNNNDDDQNGNSNNQTPTRSNYLTQASWKTSSSSSKTPPASAVPSVPRASGVQGNYLEALSRQPAAAPEPEEESSSSGEDETSLLPKRKPKKKTGRKTRKEREQQMKLQKEPTTTEEAALAVTGEESRLEKNKVEPAAPSTKTQKKVGLHGGYLETLLSNHIEGTSDPPEERSENPHVEEKSFEYEFDIDPPSLVTRIITIREQISQEWKDDLDTLVRTNDRILDDYEENQRTEAASALSSDDEDDDDKEEEEENSLKDIATPYQASQEGGKTLLYDRNMMSYLTNSIASQDRASSPLRRANLDLLLVLCTQESVHRVLHEYQEDKEDDMHMEKHEWLQAFYKGNVKNYFDGHEHSFGRADKFLETLLAQPTVAREKRDGGIYLINPIAIAEDILRERSMVAREWKSIVNTIPDEHLDLRRILFSRHLMEVSDWKIGGIGSNSLHIEESPLIEATPESGGAFE